MSDENLGSKQSSLRLVSVPLFIDESSADIETSVIIHSQRATIEFSNKTLQSLNKGKTQPSDSVSPPPDDTPSTKMRVSHSYEVKPKKRSNSNRSSHQPSSSLLNHPRNQMHKRQVSVGNLVPHSFAERSVSIIRLIDQQSNIHSPQYLLQNYSFSTKNDGNKTPSLAAADGMTHNLYFIFLLFLE